MLEVVLEKLIVTSLENPRKRAETICHFQRLTYPNFEGISYQRVRIRPVVHNGPKPGLLRYRH